MIKDTDFRSRFGTHVRVQRGLFYTVVSIDGTDVYFDRLSGSIEHVVTVNQDHYREPEHEAAADLADFVWRPEDSHKERSVQ